MTCSSVGRTMGRESRGHKFESRYYVVLIHFILLLPLWISLPTIKKQNIVPYFFKLNSKFKCYLGKKYKRQKRENNVKRYLKNSGRIFKSRIPSSNACREVSRKTKNNLNKLQVGCKLLDLIWIRINLLGNFWSRIQNSVEDPSKVF